MTEDSGDMSPSPVPVFVDSRLDQWDVGCSNCSFSDGYGQHEDYISEEMRRRQQKMHRKRKNIEEISIRESPQLWVEMKNRGLKMVEITGSL